MNKFVIVLILSFVGSACTDEGDILTPEKKLEYQIIGSWNWAESFGGFAPRRFNPDPIGTVYLIFRSDQKAYLYRRDTLQTIYQYKISEDTQPQHFVLRTDIVWSNETTGNTPWVYIIEQATPDTLILVDGCIDCYRHTYIRRQ